MYILASLRPVSLLFGSFALSIINESNTASNLGVIKSDLVRRIERLKTIRRRYRAFIIDEAQDNSPLQWRLLSRLWGERSTFEGEPPCPDTPWQPTICYVGDVKQSIYAFRQAEVVGFLEYARRLMAINQHEFASVPLLRAEPTLRKRDSSRDPRNAHQIGVHKATKLAKKGGMDTIPWIPFDLPDDGYPTTAEEVERRSKGLIRLEVNYRTEGGLLNAMNHWWHDVFSERHRDFPDGDFYADPQPLRPSSENTELSGSIDKYSDEGASKWTNEINILAANDVIPSCSSIQDKFCPSRNISVGEVAYIVNQMVGKSLISSDLFASNNFQAGWTANGSEVVEASTTAVANPNAGNDACVPRDNTNLVINSVLDVQQFLGNNGFNPGPIDGQTGPKTKNAVIEFQKENNLLADGIVGNKTKNAMRAYTGCNSQNVCIARDNSNAKLDSVADIQTYLANNGFNPGIIDGEVGSYTKEAIKAFQRKVGLIPDGVAGNRTKSEMKSYTGC